MSGYPLTLETFIYMTKLKAKTLSLKYALDDYIHVIVLKDQG